MAQSAVGRMLRCQSSSPLRVSLGTGSQTRGYATKCTAIPTFSQTSSPDLDEKLKRIREELFIPFGLPQRQRKLMFKHKNADHLDEELVTTTIGENDEEFQLRPMDPQSRPTLKEAYETISLMKNPQDWNNIIPFTSGLRMSKRPVKEDRWEWIIRKAGEAYSLGIILECAKQADRTGLQFKDYGIVRRYFFELHRMAQNVEFKGPAVSKALGLARQAVDLMEAPQHIVRNWGNDPKRKPFTIGVLLELSAARALDQYKGNDEGGLVATYVQRLLGVWPRNNFSITAKDWPSKDLMLQENVPIYNGLVLALQVRSVSGNKAIANRLKRKLKSLRQNLEVQAPEGVEKNPTIGYQQQQQLLSK